ncbi:MAG: response regulator transcription factor [Burkholderiaceae bacterium]|nr:response regulator transcription factor [Burkholderiaceae bacterium]
MPHCTPVTPVTSDTPANPATISLLVVDDHTLFRRGLIALLGQDDGLQVVGEAADAAQALRLVPALQPDVILLDNHLPGVNGIDAVKDLRRLAPQTRVLILTVSEDAQDLALALRNGAQGYLLKTIEGDLLAQAIRRAMRGEPVVSAELMGKLVTAFQAQDTLAPTSTLTASAASTAGAAGAAGAAGGAEVAASATSPALSPREKEVLCEIARGASNKEIARTLDIAETTVKIHVQHILRKLNLSSRVQAAVYATDRLRLL